ncbi:MAG: aldo/keto reductase [Gammaproteobacteria bacterium]
MFAGSGQVASLSNGVKMPWLGLGVFRVADGPEVEQVVQWALDAGYRSVDTAAVYGNEAGLGRAIRTSDVPREEIFVTTKVWNTDQGYERTLRAFNSSLKHLGMDYLDLYLIHWPVKDTTRDTWRALEKLYRDGRVRAIGVSNFQAHHLRALMEDTEIVPMVNQVEFHPYLCQLSLREFCARHAIQVQGWGTLLQGKIFDVPEVISLAGKYGKTPAQVVLRWTVQHGVLAIAKSSHRDRIQANANIFDFVLACADMAQLDALDRDLRLGPDPDGFS